MLATTKSKALEYAVRIVERAIGQDVALDTHQNPEFLPELPVEPVGLAMLLVDLLEREPAGVVRGLRMVRHSEILKAPLARRVRHRFQCLRAVGRVGVTVQDPVQVAVGDELWQLSLKRPLDFAAPSLSSGSMKGRPRAW
jgi:hypothetical protein